MQFMHGYSCYYLTIKLQTPARLAWIFFVNNYFLVRPLSDVQNTPFLISQGSPFVPLPVRGLL